MADNKTRIVITARDETRAAILSATNGLKSITAAATRLPLVGTALAAAFSAASLTAGIKSIIDGADQLNKASQKYGIAVESLSALQYAGKLSDVSLEAIGTGLKKLSVNMLDTAAGSGEARDAFKALGISVKDVDGSLKSSDAVFGDLADKFAGMEDGAGKTALAVRLFGRSGAELVPLLNQGSKGLAGMREEAERLGVIVGGDLAKKSEEFNDNITRLGEVAHASKIALASELLPTLSRFVEELLAGIKAAGGFWEALKLFGTINPFKTNTENLKVYSAELEKIQRRMQFAIGDAERASLGGQSADLKKRIEYLKEIRRQEALALTAGMKGRLDAKDIGPTIPTKAPGLPGKSAAGGSVDDLDTRIAQRVGGAISDSAIIKAREYALAVEQLDRLFFDAGLEAEVYASALEKLAGATDKSSEKTGRLAELIAATPTAKLEKAREDMVLLAEAFEAGSISAGEFTEAAQARLGMLDDKIKETGSLAKDLGLTFSSAFEDAVIGGKKLSDVLNGLAQDIARIVLRKNVTEPIGNAIAGLDFGKMISSILPSFAVGTDYVPYDMVAQIHRGERIIPAAENTAGGSVVVNVTNNAPGTQARATERNEGGTRIVDVIVDRVEAAIWGNVARGAGPGAATLADTYGLNRVAGSY